MDADALKARFQKCIQQIRASLQHSLVEKLSSSPYVASQFLSALDLGSVDDQGRPKAPSERLWGRSDDRTLVLLPDLIGDTSGPIRFSPRLPDDMTADSSGLHPGEIELAASAFGLWFYIFDASRGTYYYPFPGDNLVFGRPTWPFFTAPTEKYRKYLDFFLRDYRLMIGEGSQGTAARGARGCALDNTVLDARGGVALEDLMLRNLTYISFPIFSVDRAPGSGHQDATKRRKRFQEAPFAYAVLSFPSPMDHSSRSVRYLYEELRNSLADLVAATLEPLVCHFQDLLLAKKQRTLTRNLSDMESFDKAILQFSKELATPLTSYQERGLRDPFAFSGIHVVTPQLYRGAKQMVYRFLPDAETLTVMFRGRFEETLERGEHATMPITDRPLARFLASTNAVLGGVDPSHTADAAELSALQFDFPDTSAPPLKFKELGNRRLRLVAFASKPKQLGERASLLEVFESPQFQNKATRILEAICSGFPARIETVRSWMRHPGLPAEAPVWERFRERILAQKILEVSCDLAGRLTCAALLGRPHRLFPGGTDAPSDAVKAGPEGATGELLEVSTLSPPPTHRGRRRTEVTASNELPSPAPGAEAEHLIVLDFLSSLLGGAGPVGGPDARLSSDRLESALRESLPGLRLSPGDSRISFPAVAMTVLQDCALRDWGVHLDQRLSMEDVRSRLEHKLSDAIQSLAAYRILGSVARHGNEMPPPKAGFADLGQNQAETWDALVEKWQLRIVQVSPWSDSSALHAERSGDNSLLNGPMVSNLGLLQDLSTLSLTGYEELPFNYSLLPVFADPWFWTEGYQDKGLAGALADASSLTHLYHFRVKNSPTVVLVLGPLVPAQDLLAQLATLSATGENAGQAIGALVHFLAGEHRSVVWTQWDTGSDWWRESLVALEMDGDRLKATLEGNEGRRLLPLKEDEWRPIQEMLAHSLLVKRALPASDEGRELHCYPELVFELDKGSRTLAQTRASARGNRFCTGGCSNTLDIGTASTRPRSAAEAAIQTLLFQGNSSPADGNAQQDSGAVSLFHPNWGLRRHLSWPIAPDDDVPIEQLGFFIFSTYVSPLADPLADDKCPIFLGPAHHELLSTSLDYLRFVLQKESAAQVLEDKATDFVHDAKNDLGSIKDFLLEARPDQGAEFLRTARRSYLATLNYFRNLHETSAIVFESREDLQTWLRSCVLNLLRIDAPAFTSNNRNNVEPYPSLEALTSGNSIECEWSSSITETEGLDLRLFPLCLPEYTLKKALQELVKNALKYSDRKFSGPFIRVQICLGQDASSPSTGSVSIVLINSVDPAAKSRSSSTRAGLIGLKRRLRTNFGEEADVVMELSPLDSPVMGRFGFKCVPATYAQRLLDEGNAGNSEDRAVSLTNTGQDDISLGDFYALRDSHRR